MIPKTQSTRFTYGFEFTLNIRVIRLFNGLNEYFNRLFPTSSLFRHENLKMKPQVPHFPYHNNNSLSCFNFN